MRNCSMCKINSQCNRPWKGIDDPTSCVSFTPIKTNADRIRAMTDEELAEYLEEVVLAAVREYSNDDLLLKGELRKWRLKWLKEEAKT